MKKIKRIVWLIILIVVLFFSVKTWWNLQLSSVSDDKSSKIVVVEKGESFTEVSAALKKDKLIKNSFVFNIYGKQSNLANKIQAGTFRVSPSMTAREILKILTTEPLDNWVTLLEGWRVEEMAEKLNEQLASPASPNRGEPAGGLKIDNGEFIKKAKEGYMFPDTYLIPKDYSVEQIVNLLRSTFEQKFTQELKQKIKNQGLTEQQGVILASIVEREARSLEVRKMVASILLKRLKIGMGLNVDAAIQYALGYQKDEKSWWKKQLSLDDLQVDSPYNTYIHVGLPPTPICNPSLSSLTAVANADPTTPYLYYYHDSKGNSYYAKTLDEHNINVTNHP